MKLFKLLMLPLIGLTLMSCTPTNENSNQDNNPSIDEVNSWNYQEEALMKSVLNGNIIPYFNKPAGGKWVGVDLSNETKKMYGIAYEIEEDRTSLISEMITSLEEVGFLNITNPDKDKNPVLELHLKNYDVNKEVITCIPQIIRSERKFGALFYYSCDQIKWNQKEVDNAIFNLLNVKVSLPEPEFSFTKFEVALFAQATPPTVGVGLYTKDKTSVQSYYSTLEKAGYEKIAIESKPGQYAFIDPSNKITVTCVYDNPSNVCVIGIINA